MFDNVQTLTLIFLELYCTVTSLTQLYSPPETHIAVYWMILQQQETLSAATELSAIAGISPAHVA